MIKITKQIREFITSNTNLSANARLLYLLLADRAELSEKNREKFSDEHGIFIYFTVSEVQSVLGCSKHTALNTLDELEHTGWIVRRHTQKADRIYILQSAKIAPCRVQNLHPAECKNCTPQSAEIAPNQNSINNQESEKSSSSISGTPTLEEVRQQVDYDKMIDDDPDSVAILDILIDLLVMNPMPDITCKHLKAIITNVRGKQNITHLRAYLRSCLKNIMGDFAVKEYAADSEQSDPNSDWEKLKRLSVVDEMP